MVVDAFCHVTFTVISCLAVGEETASNRPVSFTGEMLTLSRLCWPRRLVGGSRSCQHFLLRVERLQELCRPFVDDFVQGNRLAGAARYVITDFGTVFSFWAREALFAAVCRLLCVEGVWRCVEGAWRCFEGAWRCVEGAWMCVEGAWRCVEGAWRCVEGAWRCIDGAWRCVKDAWSCVEGAWRCIEGVWNCVEGAWRCV